MNPRIVALSRNPAIRRVFRSLRFHRAYNFWLRRWPRKRVLQRSGIVYRSCRTESVSLALEMLEGGNCYDASLLPRGIKTFADIGCNVGYFPCWLADQTNDRAISGLMVDANPRTIEESRWHVAANGFKNIHVIEGLVGAELGAEKDKFFLCEADTCSTAKLTEAHLENRNLFQPIRVAPVDFGREWTRKMDGKRCDLLKIDVEGAEMNFLKQEEEFLALVDFIYIEWHKYAVSFEELDNHLGHRGFRLVKIVEDYGLNGVAVFTRRC